ncbi:MAG: S-methyl-5'-thioadenosine phosphorylase, partial [Nitrospira sp.]
MERIRVGVIGGSGIYDLARLQDVHEVRLDTPFGAPSDAYIVGHIEGQPVAFLPRHGRGHRISPSRLNSRANIYGLKMLGVEYLISLSACGSLQLQYKPGDIVIPDQLYDRTRLRSSSFFDDPDAGTAGVVVHISVADPFCPYLSSVCVQAVEAADHPVHRGGTFVTVEGPRFSTKAESRVFQHFGFAIIGMTASPEAFLAREAGISYAAMAHVTDYDVWHETEAPVTVDQVVQQFLANVEVAKSSVVNAILALRDAPPSPYLGLVGNSIMTSRAVIPAETL